MFYSDNEERYGYEDAARREAAEAVAADMEAFAAAEEAAEEDMWADWGDEADVYASIDAAEEDDHSDIPF